MAVLKIGDKVSFHLSENREQLVADLKRGTKMYGWQRGEDVETTIEEFALANPHATLGQFIDWTKKTGMIRLAHIKAGRKLPSYRLDLVEQMAGRGGPQSGQSGGGGEVPQSARANPKQGVTVIGDAQPARLKSQQTEARKVAEPGDEPQDLDQDGDDPTGGARPDVNELKSLPATDPAAGHPDPLDAPYVEKSQDKAGPDMSPGQAAKAPQNPFAAKLKEMRQE